MNPPFEKRLTECLLQARAGDKTAPKGLIPHFRKWVLQLVRKLLSPRPGAKSATSPEDEADESVRRLYFRLGLIYTDASSSCEINWGEFEQLLFGPGDPDATNQALEEFRPTLRLAIALALIAAALGLILWLTGPEDGITALPDLLALREQEVTRGRDLDEGQAAARQRHAERDRVIEDVIAGRRTLQSGADALRELYAQAPQSVRDELRKLYPARSEEETYCRAVIGFVAVALEDRPEEVHRVKARLEKELRGRSPAESQK
jgi:hypothetical protein